MLIRTPDNEGNTPDTPAKQIKKAQTDAPHGATKGEI